MLESPTWQQGSWNGQNQCAYTVLQGYSEVNERKEEVS